MELAQINLQLSGPAVQTHPSGKLKLFACYAQIAESLNQQLNNSGSIPVGHLTGFFRIFFTYFSHSIIPNQSEDRKENKWKMIVLLSTK